MRVVAGELGGRRLRAPRGLHTRPTSDRVREALFGALGGLEGASVVDLYAGSGALGIEALSRGATRADFVEAERQAREVLAENLEALGLRGRATVWPFRLPQGLARLAARLAVADLVLADPPYGGGPARDLFAALGAPGVLRAGTRVVLERHRKDVVPEVAGALARAHSRRHGETVVDTYVAGGGAAAPGAGGR